MKYGTMLISQYQSRTWKEKVIANKEKGQRGPDKEAHLKTPSLTCLVSPRTHHGFSQKKTTRFFCRTSPSPSGVVRVVRGGGAPRAPG